MSMPDRGAVTPATAKQQRPHRVLTAIAALAGLGASVAFVAAVSTLDPGRASSDPRPALSQETLGLATALTDQPLVQLTGYLQAAAVILLILFAAQLSARIGAAKWSNPTGSVFAAGLVSLIGFMFAIEWGFTLALGEVGLERDDSLSVFSYFVWTAWAYRIIGFAFVGVLITVAVFGMHSIVGSPAVRWLSAILAAILLWATVGGRTGAILFIGFAWVAGLSILMVVHALMPAKPVRADG